MTGTTERPLLLPVLHRRRLREIWRSAGWPCRDTVEVELLAAGLLERRNDRDGRETLHLTQAGITALAATLARNRAAFDAHEALVARVAEQMQRDGRIVWRRLSLRAPLPPQAIRGTGREASREAGLEAGLEAGNEAGSEAGDQTGDDAGQGSRIRWAMAMPDVYSIRHTTVEAFTEPAVHEIKVRRGDLLADLRRPDKGAAYRALSSQCWYVLGPGVGTEADVPAEYGVLLATDTGLELARPAPRRAVTPVFAVWMALARATAEPPIEDAAQSPLRPEHEAGSGHLGSIWLDPTRPDPTQEPSRMPQPPSRSPPKNGRTHRNAGPSLAPIAIDLALQGGGSHGAYTWGVLDRLLEDQTLDFDGVSGTSAGALNAAVLATGMAAGGRAGAQAALRAFWLDVAEGGSCFGAAPGPHGLPGMPALPLLPPFGLASYNLDWHPAYRWFQQFLQTFSPYQFNPLNLDPLREVVERHVNPLALSDGPLALFITATAVQSGQPRVFDRRDLSIDALLASACLPHLFRAVMIAGAEGGEGGPPEPYWDGGYTGNPALWPLIYHTTPLDILLVQINPRRREGTPDTRLEIDDRLAEITFNAALGGELRAIAFVQKLFAERRIDVGGYKNLRLHGIFGDTALAELHASSKLNTERDFLLRLHDLGHAAAETWWQENRRKLGREATIDAHAEFLARPTRKRHA